MADKLTRYGPTVGALAWESYGRMAPESVELLALLAAAAAHCASPEARPPRLGPAWRLACERALAWATADVVLLGSTQRPSRP